MIQTSRCKTGEGGTKVGVREPKPNKHKQKSIYMVYSSYKQYILLVYCTLKRSKRFDSSRVLCRVRQGFVCLFGGEGFVLLVGCGVLKQQRGYAFSLTHCWTHLDTINACIEYFLYSIFFTFTCDQFCMYIWIFCAGFFGDSKSVLSAFFLEGGDSQPPNCVRLINKQSWRGGAGSGAIKIRSSRLSGVQNACWCDLFIISIHNNYSYKNN